MSNNYPALQQLFGSYFHQDWSQEFATPEAAAQAFINGSDAKTVRQALEELDLFIRNTPLDGLATQLSHLGSYYMALEPGHENAAFSKDQNPKASREAHAQAIKQWLGKLRDNLSRASLS